jgi:hypothetical protein
MWATLKGTILMATLANNFAPPAVAQEPVEKPGLVNYFLNVDGNIASLSPGLGAAVAYGLNIKEKAEGFNVRRGMVDDRITASANLFELEKLANGLADYAGRYDDVHSGLAAAIKQKEAAVEAKVALTPSAYATEIRSVFLAMPSEDRSAAMAAAFKDGDKEVLAALVNAPAITHGCDREQLAAQYEVYKRDAAYGEYQVLDEHKKAMRYLEASFPGIMKWKADIYKGTKNYAEKRAQQKAIMASYGIELGDD